MVKLQLYKFYNVQFNIVTHSLRGGETDEQNRLN